MADQTDLLAEVLEKMIDCQTANTQALTSLKSTVDQSSRVLEEVADHFTDGFRSEIKEHVTEELKPHKEVHDQIVATLKTIEEKIDNFKSIGFWSKIMVSFVVALGAIAVVIQQLLKLVGGP